MFPKYIKGRPSEKASPVSITLAACLLVALIPLLVKPVRRATYSTTITHSWTQHIVVEIDPIYDLIVGLTHHKTGTFQIQCIQEKLSSTVHLPSLNTPSCIKDNDAGAQDLLDCLSSADTPPRPAQFKTHHGMRQTCMRYEGQPPWKPCLSLMLSRSCTKGEVSRTRLPAETCTLDLPTDTKLAFINEIRNPIDAVISAYMFHITIPSSEPWLYRWKKPFYAFGLELKWLGASAEDLVTFGFGNVDLDAGDAMASDSTAATAGGELDQLYASNPIASNVTTYGQVLIALPTEYGVRMEFWHSLPELWSMVRQYVALKNHPGAKQPRFEDLKYEFNATMMAIIDHLHLSQTHEGDSSSSNNNNNSSSSSSNREKLTYKQQHVVLDAIVAGGCDPNAWSQDKRAKSTHITAGKSDDKFRVEQALMSYEVAKQELCQMAAMMEYSDPRCDGVVVRTPSL